ncbi:hypothetical protein FJTKL_10772 [Diaporthe vaccinii]|uniref:Uncharacterized protein n=1 Tax=Diaporthe vaccinii TaxID=105482 RepID=A0ABR4FBP8_9PEZI
MQASQSAQPGLLILHATLHKPRSHLKGACITVLVQTRRHPRLSLIPSGPLIPSLLLTALPTSHAHELHGKQDEDDRGYGNDESQQRVVVPGRQSKWEAAAQWCQFCVLSRGSVR